MLSAGAMKLSYNNAWRDSGCLFVISVYPHSSGQWMLCQGWFNQEKMFHTLTTRNLGTRKWPSSNIWVQIYAVAGWWNTLATCRPSLLCTAWLRKPIPLSQSPPSELVRLHPIRNHPLIHLGQSEESASQAWSIHVCTFSFEMGGYNPLTTGLEFHLNASRKCSMVYTMYIQININVPLRHLQTSEELEGRGETENPSLDTDSD